LPGGGALWIEKQENQRCFIRLHDRFLKNIRPQINEAVHIALARFQTSHTISVPAELVLATADRWNIRAVAKTKSFRNDTTGTKRRFGTRARMGMENLSTPQTWCDANDSSALLQKFSISQALLLRVTIVKARFPSSGEVSGVSTRLLVAHNSKLAPFDCTSSIESWVEKLIRDAGEAFVSEVDPRDMAAFVLAVMEGAVMQARASRSIEPLHSAIETLRDYVRRVLKQKKETEQT